LIYWIIELLIHVDVIGLECVGLECVGSEQLF